VGLVQDEDRDFGITGFEIYVEGLPSSNQGSPASEQRYSGPPFLSCDRKAIFITLRVTCDRWSSRISARSGLGFQGVQLDRNRVVV
jgi:hypothetical protein